MGTQGNVHDGIILAFVIKQNKKEQTNQQKYKCTKKHTKICNKKSTSYFLRKFTTTKCKTTEAQDVRCVCIRFLCM